MARRDALVDLAGSAEGSVQMNRSAAGRLACALVVASMLMASTAAAAGIQIRRVDASGYPLIRVLVVVPPGSTRAPTLNVGGAASAGRTSENLAGKESIALVIDRSQAMRGVGLADAIRAASAFVSDSPATDQVSLVGVASHPTTLSGFSAGGSAVIPALRGLSLDPYSGVALWQALLRAADSLRFHSIAGRVIVVLTAGRNSDPSHSLADAIRAARVAHVTVYAIGIPSRELVRGHWITLGHRWYTPRPLQQLAAATGGRFYPAPSSADFSTIYQAIGAELRRTWQLTFATAARPGETLTLTVNDGSNRATRIEQLSGALPTPPGTQGLNTFLLLAGGVIGVFVATAAVKLIRAATRRRWRRRYAAGISPR